MSAAAAQLLRWMVAAHPEHREMVQQRLSTDHWYDICRSCTDTPLCGGYRQCSTQAVVSDYSATPSSWQRIFGDFTSGWLIPAPGAPQMLAPYTRQLVWEGPIPDSCVNWSQPPASFQLNALFPAPSIGKCGDTLRFTVRYTFTDCECRTCDTLITYTIVRHNWLIAYPWDNIAVKRVAPDAIDIVIPGTQAVSEDSSQSVALGMIELRTGKPSDVQVYRCERDENCEQPADDVMVTITEGGCVIIFTKREGAGIGLGRLTTNWSFYSLRN